MKSKVSGFTLVELMVVAVVVGLVVLVSSQIPLFSLSSWRKGSERLKLQRDAHYAILRIEHKLRSASLSNIDVVSDPSRLLIDLSTDESFFLQENQLFYKNPQGTQELVIEGETGTQFNVTNPNGTINVALTLVRGNVQTILRTAVKPRN